MTQATNRPHTLVGLEPGALEGLFARGKVPDPPPDGRLKGALLHMTIGPAGGLIARTAGAWLGKRFDAAGGGENVFDRRLFKLGRLLTPAAYRAWWPEDGRAYRALRFTTVVAPGELDPGVGVLRISYDLPENAPLLRRVVDELVEVEPGVYLGQALLRRRGGHRRLAWFTLE
ncbi:MAG TPA: hypothetical protein VE777_08980 [Gaiellales bacterium]|nr:hypothetical protein [Gaiellales bacterium]